MRARASARTCVRAHALVRVVLAQLNLGDETLFVTCYVILMRHGGVTIVAFQRRRSVNTAMKNIKCIKVRRGMVILRCLSSDTCQTDSPPPLIICI